MKKIIRSRLFTFILGLIVMAGISYGVYAINASEITYNDTTVDLALDNLYSSVIKGDILYSSGEYDTTSLTLKSYEFTEKRNAILFVSTSHGNNNNSYYHQLNTPIITDGEMVQLYSYGTLNEQINGGNILSEYAYLIKAREGTKIEVNGKAYGYGNYRIKIIG